MSLHVSNPGLGSLQECQSFSSGVLHQIIWIVGSFLPQKCSNLHLWPILGDKEKQWRGQGDGFRPGALNRAGIHHPDRITVQKSPSLLDWRGGPIPSRALASKPLFQLAFFSQNLAVKTQRPLKSATSLFCPPFQKLLALCTLSTLKTLSAQL